MKAAAVFGRGELPRYVEEFPEPIVQNANEILISVKAVAIKHLDKARASGKHYSAHDDNKQPKVAGGDAVGILADGTRVYAMGVSGTLAEKATVDKSMLVVVPDGITDEASSALPNAVMGSALALRFRAAMKPGEIVLINGATGFTGKVAVQIARQYGAKKIIVTGRNEQTLQQLLTSGADEAVSLQQDDENIVGQLKNLYRQFPVDIVLDYLWGHSAELILETLKGNGNYSHKTRYVTIGGMTGDKIQLSSSVLRSTDLQLSGSGLGSWTKEEIQALITEILPAMFKLAAEKKLLVETIVVELKDIEKVWSMDVPGGKRLVVKI